MKEVISKLGPGAIIVISIFGLTVVDNVVVNICKVIAYKSSLKSS